MCLVHNCNLFSDNVQSSNSHVSEHIVTRGCLEYLHMCNSVSSVYVHCLRMYAVTCISIYTTCEQTPRQFDELYENRSTQLGYTPTLVRGIAYDAVWALALGLNRTQEMFLSNYNVSEIGCDGLDGGLVSLEQFNYSNGVMGCVMRWSLEQTDFSGVSVSCY